MKKGFIHIVEIIIIALVVFILVIQLSATPENRPDWDRAKLKLQGYDAISTLDKMGINWFEKEEVVKAMDGFFSGSVRYDLMLKNAIKSNISVGCICSANETEWLSSLLTPFRLNSQNITFHLKWIDPSNPSFPVNLNVIFIGEDFFSSKDLTPYRTEIENYLSYDNGLVELRDLDAENKINGKPVQEEIFGLKWDDSVNVNTNSLEFSTHAESLYYGLYKYFHHIPTATGRYIREGFEFPNFLSGEKVKPSDGLEERIALKQKGTNASAVIARDGIVDSRGRSVWISAGRDDEDEKKLLVKSAIVWASGQSYHIVENLLLKPVKISYMKTIQENDFDPGMYQLMEIVLQLGYVY
jgi:hypothetical protein